MKLEEFFSFDFLLIHVHVTKLIESNKSDVCHSKISDYKL